MKQGTPLDLTHCPHCTGPMPTGRGGRQAKLCLDCWTELLLRLQQGERQMSLAREYDVSYSTIKTKARFYLREVEA